MFGLFGGNNNTVWNEHVSEFREEHPDLRYKEQLIKASETYRPKYVANSRSEKSLEKYWVGSTANDLGLTCTALNGIMFEGKGTISIVNPVGDDYKKKTGWDKPERNKLEDIDKSPLNIEIKGKLTVRQFLSALRKRRIEVSKRHKGSGFAKENLFGDAVLYSGCTVSKKCDKVTKCTKVRINWEDC